MKPNTVMLAVLSAFTALPAFSADETPPAAQQAEVSENLDTVVVRGETYANRMGTQRIRESEIARRPSTNGNLTELLRTNPNVRFSNNSGNSTSGGEIRPDEVSFHGEKFYNNNFTIDGVSNNDNTDPGNQYDSDTKVGGQNPYDLPAGSTQSFWVDSSLVKTLEVFDSNVSAKYGNFTGGLVNARLKDPNTQKSSGKVFFRTTRDSWARFHIQDGKEDEFYAGSSLTAQPKYTKRQYGLMLNQPVNDKAAVLFSYNRTESDIPFMHRTLNHWNAATNTITGPFTSKQERSAETWLLRGSYRADDGSTWKATAMYSPHKSKFLLPSVKDGKYSNTGGGVRFDLAWDKDLGRLNMESQIAYRKTANEIEYGSNVYRSYRTTRSIDWISASKVNTSGNAWAHTGGYGEYSTEKSTLTLKQNYSLKQFFTGAWRHRIGFGWQADFADAKYKRDQNAYVYQYAAAANVACNGDPECIDGEQYANNRKIYPARNVKVNDSTYSLYLQDNIFWKRLSVNAGLRFDRNSYLKNNNLAPRFAASYDVFGNTQTRIFGGANRYYSASMLAYKLREGISGRLGATRRLSGNTPGAWSSDKDEYGTLVRYTDAKVKTPYSDEIDLGVSQKMFGSLWTLKWVHRNGKDQFTRTKVAPNTYALTNEGWSKNDTFTLAVSPLKPYKSHYAEINWSIGFNVSKSKTNNGNTYDELNTERYVYNGTLLPEGETPPSDFNTPWSAVASLNTYFPKIRLNWDQVLRVTGSRNFRYTSGSVDCSSPSNRALCGSYTGQAPVLHDDGRISRDVVLDWRFAYKQPIRGTQALEVTLDVNNVLDRVTFSSRGSSRTYKMGRNYWLGVSYNW